MRVQPASPETQAQHLAAALPKLILAAERLAWAVAPGLHGRRRTGQGDAFWQFREAHAGDDARRIDWRRSAQGDRHYIRERESEAQASIALSLEDTPTLDFSSSTALPQKRDRAILLLLATAALLLRAGERVALSGITTPKSGPRALSVIAHALNTGGKAAPDPRARHIRFGDFLTIAPSVSGPRGGAVVQILDPAECDFPYQGRYIFSGFSGEAPLPAARAQDLAAAYRTRLTAHRAAIAHAALRAGQTPLFHRTDHAPALVLTTLYQALSPR